MSASLPGQPPRLVALQPVVQATEYTLTQDVYTLGRWAMCQIVVQLNVVSRLHAKIERQGPHYLLSDIGSANGTFVNNRPLHEPRLLKDQDVIGLGTPAGLLRFADPDATTARLLLLRYDETAMTFYLQEQPVPASPAQFRLLYHLYQHAGTVCTRDSCAEAIWGRDYEPSMDTEALDRAVATLRSLLRKLAPQADVLETRRGLGYVLTPWERQ